MYPRSAFALLFSFAAIGLGVAIPALPVDQCGLNAEFRECGSACAPTCANLIAMHPGPVCTLQCVSGCFCKEGFLKNHDGKCVRLEECPQPHHMQLPVDQCGLNAEFRECGSACAPTCANLFAMHPGPVCTKQCVTGCFCKEGFLKNHDGKCVRLEECPQPHINMQIPSAIAFPPCPDNEQFQACGSACAPTCANPHPSPVCTKNCVVGCFCKEGHLRSAQGVCVPANQCQVLETSMLFAFPDAKVCGDNEEYRQCKGCDGTCDNPDPLCPRNCVPGCACKQGHLRAGANGKCIPKEQCPVPETSMLFAFPQDHCGANEVFMACGSACHPTCAKPNPGPICTLQCITGCFCKPGYLKNSEGLCVPANQCDAKVCGDNEEYRQCKGCDGTCDKPNPLCPRICIPGCACKQGHLRTGANGKCIPKEQCQAPAALTQPQCPQNEVFHSCGTACPATCANPHPSPVCTRNCVIGCFCQEGFLRNEKGVCVAATNCEAPQPLAAIQMQMLPPNMCLSDREVFVKECGNQADCVASCHVVTFLVHGVPQIPKKCMVRMCKPQCVCKHPFVRNQQGDCVEKKECDQVPFTTTQVPMTTTH